jgi:hypothetical protein
VREERLELRSHCCAMGDTQHAQPHLLPPIADVARSAGRQLRRGGGGVVRGHDLRCQVRSVAASVVALHTSSTTRGAATSNGR